MGEKVQVYYKNRSPQLREKLGEAEIIAIVQREVRSGKPAITELDAHEDGFDSIEEMRAYMSLTYGKGYPSRFNRLTLKWV